MKKAILKERKKIKTRRARQIRKMEETVRMERKTEKTTRMEKRIMTRKKNPMPHN